MHEFVWLALIGLVAGASGGLLGIGGSTVMIPGLVLVFGATPGDRQHLYQAAAMIVNFFVVAPAVLRHHQARAKIVGLVGLPAGLAGGLLGVGGGLVAVPAQQVFLRVPLANAIANSASTILWSSVIGAALKLLHLSEHGFRPKDALIMVAGLT